MIKQYNNKIALSEIKMHKENNKLDKLLITTFQVESFLCNLILF